MPKLRRVDISYFQSMAFIAGDLWLPEEAAAYRRNSLLTSRALAWRGVILAHQQMAPGAYSTPPILSHSLSLHVQQPVLLTRTDDGKTQRGVLECGDLHLSVAGQAPRWHHSTVSEVINIGIDPLFLRQIIAQMELDVGQVELIPQFQTSDPLIESILHALLNELKVPEPGSRLYIESLTNQLAVRLIRRYATHVRVTEPRHGRLSTQQRQQIDDYIHAHLAEDISLAQLADVVHLSPYHFARCFKLTAGLSPYQYLLARRVNYAIHLLQTSPERSLLEVAVSVGFYDQSHLSRHLKRIYGVTPGQVKAAR
ncbi:MAG: AraC family transcriptional regulator [Caldilinea sp.]|nr:helix-turn-helix transcriptional regulator [Caldilineaceae bacterium]MCO5210421.1 AraC family transcriptional regulator [Caldilinea sp.]MCB0067746.1 helix-turn-helix transcriptional regulator [Caldilineaceae bacterium]MCB0134980.1 helix-turn-helix transcriptional regulator [Caldilineaceae bacterium]MCB0147451.1 helix-turn-helix transcriptional regulator [Caldilineaceae bacterium]